MNQRRIPAAIVTDRNWQGQLEHDEPGALASPLTASPRLRAQKASSTTGCSPFGSLCLRVRPRITSLLRVFASLREVRIVRPFPLACCIFALAASRPALADSVDDYIKSEMSKQQIPGLSLAVLWKGKPIKVKSYGVADLDSKTPVTLETAYDVGSVAKPFTAAAVLMLVERGKIRLDDPVTRFLSNVPVTWNNITVRHLLTNTSGIKDYTTEIPTTARLEFTEDLIYMRAVGGGIKFPAGTQFSYSQTNYVLLGMVIRAATGRPFYEYVSDQFFKPLEMTRTQPAAIRKPVPNLAVGYRLVDGQRTPAEREKREFGDAFFSSTINDMVNWAAALDTGAILSEPARNLMWTPTLLAPAAPVRRPTPIRSRIRLPQRGGTSAVPPAEPQRVSAAPPADPEPEPAAPKPAPYGAGWYTEDLKGHRVLGHGGSVGGFSANLTRFPDDNLTVIILTNLRDVKVFPLIRGVAGRYSTALK